jgi:hypothetical protein
MSAPSNVSKSEVAVTTGKTQPRATDPIQNGNSTQQADKDKIVQPKKVLSIFPNPLEKFASYSAVWTLACLPPKQFNNPSSYRREGALDNIVFSSAGRYDSKRAKTAYGTPEFYINNFTMKTVVAANQRTGNSNAIKFEWDIYEPYSMGLLLQSLQIAARNSGYTNYLDNAPYCLRLDFKGFDEDGTIIETIKSKFFVLKLVSVKFEVTESGSSYKMEAIPYNHQGFSDDINTTYNDLKLEADTGVEGTVEHLLQTGTKSLAAALNKIEEDLKKDEKITVKDIYEIQFPESSSGFKPFNQPTSQLKKATANPADAGKPPNITVAKGTNVQVVTDFEVNPIGKSNFGFSQERGGNFSFKKEGDVILENGLVRRDNMTIDPKNRSFLFAQGQTITAMINQIILSSVYAKEAMIPKEDGFVRWWRIDVQIEILDYDPLIGDFARKFTYRVVPFLVHHTIFSNPNAAPIGYGPLDERIVKRYSYIYTGQNIDVLKFDIKIDNLFYTGTNSSTESDSAQVSNPANGGTAASTPSKAVTGKGAAPAAKAANLGRSRPKRDPRLVEAEAGGSGTKDTEQKVAEAFHRAFVSGASADLIKVNLEILGDPYWMVDSGMGNYFASAEADNSQITNDGTMNYESGDVFVYLTFRTPSDVDEITGLYKFPSISQESPFSGIYRVIMCENQFSEGMFRQKLECIRMPGQAGDFKDADAAAKRQPTDPATSNATYTSGKEEQKTAPIDNNGYPVGIRLYNEDGSESNFRRNPETGELYDATALQRNGL